jgi:hypothetical protein
MGMEGKERAVLRQYLLGELAESERSQLAERYFGNEEFFDELLDVENELIDQYVRRQLSLEERKAFNEYLTALPDGVSKLATAHALMEAARESLPARSSGGFYVSIRRWMQGGRLIGQRPILRFALAAILIASLVALGYQIVTEQRLHRELEQLRAAQTEAQQEKLNFGREKQTVEGEQAVQHARIRQLEAELDQARRNSSQRTSKEAGGAVVASLVLTPTLRSGAAPDLLTVTPKTRAIRLVIPVANEEQITSYRLVLQTTEGRLVFRQERLRPKSRRRGSTVTCRLAAARLTSGNYKLTLIGRPAEGAEIAQDFYFNLAGR